jgi:hypothetical protein
MESSVHLRYLTEFFSELFRQKFYRNNTNFYLQIFFSRKPCRLLCNENNKKTRCCASTAIVVTPTRHIVTLHYIVCCYKLWPCCYIPLNLLVILPPCLTFKTDEFYLRSDLYASQIKHRFFPCKALTVQSS